MSSNWDKYEEAAEKGPWAISVKVILLGAAVCALLWILGTTFGIIGGTVEVAKQEFSASAMLKKYEWFKDASAVLDKKQADIKVYQTRIDALQEDYSGVARKDWPRSDREQMSIWRTEVAGVTASYNSLAATYNAQMSKFNWKFANVGQLPQGAETIVPREYSVYKEN